MRLGTILLLTIGLTASADEEALNQRFRSEIEPLLEQYCFKCHDEDGKAVDLASVMNVRTALDHGRIWQTGIRYLRDKQMPPADKPSPTDEERERLATWFSDALGSLDCTEAADPGQPTIRRLSRAEYDYTIRDLLGLDLRIAEETFPGDAGGHGFDNFADALFLSPMLMERYLFAADKIVDEMMKKPPPVESARDFLETFLPRAFRRPAKPEEIAQRLKIFEQASEKNDTFEEALKPVIKSVLVSPHFIYRQEIEKDSDEPWPVNDHELAVRLSYLLWSSMPDDELFDLASRGNLHPPEMFAQQVHRMLKDPKSRALADHFAAQWLGFDRIMFVSRHEFSPLSWRERKEMFNEAALLFDTIVRNDLSVLKLIDADFTFLNRSLADRYGLKDIKDQIERWEDKEHPQPLKRFGLKDRTRGGIVTTAAILVSTSDTYRTSPVRRGSWVLQELLGTSPPPPPPDVGSIPAQDKKRTIRQLLTQHAADPTCASCHDHIDPMGYPLEQFDLHAKFKPDADARTTLPDGRVLTNVVELKDYLLTRQDTFLRHLVEHFMIYALGRELDYRIDECTIQNALKALEHNEHRFSALVHAITTSRAFQYRRQ